MKCSSVVHGGVIVVYTLDIRVRRLNVSSKEFRDYSDLFWVSQKVEKSRIMRLSFRILGFISEERSLDFHVDFLGLRHLRLVVSTEAIW